MKSIEDPGDSDYGSRVLAALRKRGISTSRWNHGTIRSMTKASRLEFLCLFKQHDRLVSYALIEVIRTAAPEALVERLLADKAQEQLAAIIPLMFL